ncbi:MAG: Rrf2 family transcriptional regulator, partial [bacterium]
AGQKEGEWIPSSILIKKLRVPPVFWAKIVQTLVKNKIIGSRKGKDGGIRLVKPDVSLFQVIAIFEANFCLNKCLRKGGGCFLQKACPLHRVLKELDQTLKIKLAGITLKQISKKGGEK